MAVSDRPSTKVERASARLIRSPLAQTVRRRDFRDPAPDCSACGSFDDVRHGLGFGDVDGVAASFLTDRSASSLRHHPLGRRWDHAGWAPETDLTQLKVDHEIGSHVLVSETGPVRVIPVGERWSEREVKSILKDG
jgi:hypothetical protein